MKSVQLGNLRLDVPIIQGGMGIGVSLGNLAGHVMKEGGMGVISAAQPGYNDPNFARHPFESNIEALKQEIKKAREIAKGKGLLGVNIMVAGERYDEYAKAIAQLDIDAIISGAGLPLNLPELVEGSKALIAPIVSSGKAAMLLCKRWVSRYNRLPDFIVIEGPLAGGHLGFSWDQIRNRQLPELKDILAEVLEQVQSFGQKIPLFAAGGIYTGKDIADVINQGADGVQMGTRFIATHECDAHQNFKQVLLDAKEEDIDYVISPSGFPGRGIQNEFIRKLMAEGKIAVRRCVNCLKPCNPANTPYCITDALIEAVKGNVNEGLVFTGSNGYRLDQLVSVKQLMDELIEEAAGWLK